MWGPWRLRGPHGLHGNAGKPEARPSKISAQREENVVDFSKSTQGFLIAKSIATSKLLPVTCQGPGVSPFLDFFSYVFQETTCLGTNEWGLIANGFCDARSIRGHQRAWWITSSSLFLSNEETKASKWVETSPSLDDLVVELGQNRGSPSSVLNFLIYINPLWGQQTEESGEQGKGVEPRPSLKFHWPGAKASSIMVTSY